MGIADEGRGMLIYQDIAIFLLLWFVFSMILHGVSGR